jgi:hypothetical protein
MKNTNGRLTRLEQRVLGKASVQDYSEMPAFLAMVDADREKLVCFADRFSAAGHLRDFSDEDLHEFERLLIPFGGAGDDV